MIRGLTVAAVAAVAVLALTAVAPAAHAGSVPGSCVATNGATVTLDGRGTGYVRTGTFAAGGVWLYGDSITVQTARGFPRWSVDARWGRSSTAAVAPLTADLSTGRRPRVIVVAAGSNDFLTLPALHVAVTTAGRAAHRAGAKFVWVNVFTTNRPDSAAVNGVIGRAVAMQGGTVADWAGLVAALTPAWPSMLGDGLHVGCDGAYWRTNLVARAAR